MAIRLALFVDEFTSYKHWHNALLQGGLIEPPLVSNKPDELIAAERLIISSQRPLSATLSLFSQYQISTVVEQRIAANKPTLLVGAAVHAGLAGGGQFDWLGLGVLPGVLTRFQAQHNDVGERVKAPHLGWKDRKSTRLNSSHVAISYAVFC